MSKKQMYFLAFSASTILLGSLKVVTWLVDVGVRTITG